MLSYRTSLRSPVLVSALILAFGAFSTHGAYAASPCLKPAADAGASGLMDVVMGWTKKVHQINMGSDFNQPQASTNMQNSIGNGTDVFQQIYQPMQGGLSSIAQSVLSSLGSLMGLTGGIGSATGSSITGASGGSGAGGCQSAPTISRFNWTGS